MPMPRHAALAAAVLLAACAEAPIAPVAPAPPTLRAAISDNAADVRKDYPIDWTFDVPCGRLGPETVTVAGTQHSVFQFKIDNPDHVLFRVAYSTHAEGIGSVSGDTYRLSGSDHVNSHFVFGGLPLTYNNTFRLNLHALGGGARLAVTEHVRVLVDENGVEDVRMDRMEASCEP